MSLKQIAIDFLTLAAAGRPREAFERFVGPGFRHHNPFFKGDGVSLVEAMEESGAQCPDKILEVQQALEEGDRVAVLSWIRQHPKDRGAAVVHLFRFSEGRIVELWDIGQDIPEALVNENGMF
jgi:predicted SnoaL-like aldol condensation-catalyzing enzyme